jgi:hypothetical protein
VNPWTVELRELRLRPSEEDGPVDFWAFSRFASICFWEDIAGITYFRFYDRARGPLGRPGGSWNLAAKRLTGCELAVFSIACYREKYGLLVNAHKKKLS